VLDTLSAKHGRSRPADEGGRDQRDHHRMIVGHLGHDDKGCDWSLNNSREVRDHPEEYERRHRC
jgi:hypothetical protein